MKVLLLSYKMPFSLKDGGDYSVYMSAQSLLAQSNCEVKMIAMNTVKDWFPANQGRTDFQDQTRFEWVRVDNRLKPINMIQNFFSKSSDFVERFYSEEYKEKCIQVLKDESFDVIQLEHLYLTTYLSDLREQFSGPIVLRAQNVEFKLWKSFRDQTKNVLARFYLKSAVEKLKKFEFDTMQKLDGVIALTKADQADFSKMNSELPTTTIPIAFDPNSVGSIQKNQNDDLPEIYHLGSMDWRPNVQAVDWFINEVFPLLTDRCPEIKVRLAGKKMPSRFFEKANKNLIVDGEVACAKHYIDSKSILIVPLRSGSGIRVKIIEAMAKGKAVVSTSLGAEGINCTHEENILIADSPHEFARAIQRCYESKELRTKLGQNAQKLAHQQFEIHQVGRQKLTFYETLIH